MVALTFMIFLVVQVSTSVSETKALPRGLIVLLEKIGMPVENYLDIVMSDPNPATSTEQYDESTTVMDYSHFPKHSSGVNTTIMPGILDLGEAGCNPRPTAIKVPKDPLYLNLPSYVTLHRCTGGCPATQNTHNCTVTHQTEMNIRVLKIQPPSPYMAIIKMYNHTACACDCIKRKSDCDLVKHRWEPQSCACLCKHDGSNCDLQIHRWNSATCECECINPPSHCAYKKEWDPNRCGCYCKQTYHNNCQSQNLNIDPSTCNCVNPNIGAF